MESALRQSLLYGDSLIFFKRPISAIFIAMGLFFIISPIFFRFSGKRKVLA